MKLKQTVYALGIVGMITGALLMGNVTPAAADCGSGKEKVKTSIINCPSSVKSGSDTVMWLLLTTVNILAVGVGIAAVAGIVWAGILYTTAADNASQVAKAKSVIANVIVGIVAYALMFSLLNFLVPGGIFN